MLGLGDTSFADAIRAMIGSPPPGYEALEYLVSATIFLILFGFVAELFKQVARLLGMR
jgi:hypothetical protein